MTRLSALIESAGIVPDALEGDAEIVGISADSRKVEPGSLFICMPSENTDSHRFIEGAVKSGAVAVLAHGTAGFVAARDAGAAAVLLTDEGNRFAELVWRISRFFYRNPTKSMKVIGVTGTNGKTTTAWLLRDLLQHQGLAAGYLGTLGFQIPGETRELPNTTPFAVDLYGMMDEARRAGVQALAMEVSSHALDQRRVDGIEFDAAVFTNLTQDHLDYHGTMERYAGAKFRLFAELGPMSCKNFRAAVNIDDPYGRVWATQLGPQVFTYGSQDADLNGSPISVSLEQIALKLESHGRQAVAQIPLGGAFNVQNCLSATAGMLCLGYDIEAIAEALGSVRPVPGRFEPVPNAKGIGVIVDYAHTPDALEKLLDSVRELHPTRVVTVFGCGGDRDRTKRPKMAKAASERSDLVVITSDNPRTEDPSEIMREVERGLIPGVPTCSIVDRREAIACTVQRAKPGDVVVIAGKGHEDYQIIGRTKFPMDDREIAKEALRS
jgi:UDP-N-acetylmuramoyl-L-alanyl-D-glutamate--2,6-diaminopimelate ligase